MLVDDILTKLHFMIGYMWILGEKKAFGVHGTFQQFKKNILKWGFTKSEWIL